MQSDGCIMTFENERGTITIDICKMIGKHPHDTLAL